jgi:hypothetical protein
MNTVIELNQSYNPYNIFDKEIVDEIIDEVMDFKVPTLDTEKENKWNEITEKYKNMEQSEMTENDIKSGLGEISIAGLNMLSESLKNILKLPH